MMISDSNNLVFSVLWCIAQVTILSSFALLFTSCIASSVRHKARFLNATMLVVAMVTVAAFAPRLPVQSDENPNHAKSVAEPETRQSFASDLKKQDSQTGGIDLFAAWKTLSQQIVLGNPIGSRLTRIGSRFRINYGMSVTILAGILLLVGSVRVLLSMFFLWRVRASGLLIGDAEITGELEQLKLRLGCEQQIVLIESNLVQNAAIIGGWPNALVLPVGWRNWTPAERRAVLAHELAHVVRRDPFWRLLFALVTAIHFYNPLVHLLFRRSALQQEVAADRRAATAIGRRGYLQALLQLAIRQDDLLRTSTGSGFLAVHSEFLIRRIKMLRTRDGRSHKPKDRRAGRILSAASLTLLVAFAFGSTTIKTVAQEGQSATDDQAIQKATFESDSPKPTIDKPFTRQPIDFIQPETNDSGMFVLRLSELLRCEGMSTLVPLVNSAINSSWTTETFPGSPSPKIDIRDIKYLAGIGQLGIGRASHPSDETNPNRIVFGTPLLEITLHHPVEFDEFMEQVPNVEKVTKDGNEWYQITIPTFGPGSSLMRANENKIIVELPSQRLPSKPNGNSTPSPRLNEAWQREDGGLFAGVASNRHFTKVVGNDELQKSARQILEKVNFYGLSFDITKANELVYRVVLDTGSLENAVEVKSLVEDLQSQPRTEEAPDKFLDFANASVDVRENKTGTASVIISGKLQDAAAAIIALIGSGK